MDAVRGIPGVTRINAQYAESIWLAARDYYTAALAACDTEHRITVRESGGWSGCICGATFDTWDAADAHVLAAREKP